MYCFLINATLSLNPLPQLKVIVHVSTAYSNCPLSVIDEKFYEPQCDPRQMIELAEKVDRNEFDEDTLITLTPKIVRPWPNTYSFTKALCEDMVKDFGEKLPITMVRPSIGELINHLPLYKCVTFAIPQLLARTRTRSLGIQIIFTD